MNNDIIERALATLNAGGTLLYPTDTIWGIGCDAVNPMAIERVYAIKERDHSKSMLILASAKMLSPEMPGEVRQLLLESERPTTVVLPACYVVHHCRTIFWLLTAQWVYGCQRWTSAKNCSGGSATR